MKTFKISLLLFLTPSLLIGCGQQKFYTVTFDSNGGTPVESQHVKEGGTATKPADPTHPDETGIAYTFYNWCLDKEGKNAYDFSTVVTSNITLYAHWNMTPLPTPSGLDFTYFSISVRNNTTIAFDYAGTDLKVYWGDGSEPDSATSHTYQKMGFYDIYVTGHISTISFADENGILYSYGNMTITSIIFSNTITHLKPYAVALNSWRLNQVVIPKSVARVASTTFTNDNGLICYCGAEKEPDGWEEGWDESMEYVYWNNNLYLSQIDKVLYASYSPTDNADNLIAAVYRAYRSDITEITILDEILIDGVPAPVVGVEPYAFAGLQKLQKINIDNVKQLSYIGDGAFSYSGLTSFIVPKTVTQIDGNPFRHCASLNSLTVASGNTVYESPVNSNLIINKDSFDIVAYTYDSVIPTSGYEYLNIPDSLCAGDLLIEEINLGPLVKNIAYSAFAYCTNLHSITIPNDSQLEKIGGYAFDNSGIKNINIPKSVKTIEGWAFKECQELESVAFADGSNFQPSDSYTFYNCSKLKSLNLGNNSNMTETVEYCFEGSPALETINFGSGGKLNHMQIYSFNDNSLKSITLPASLKTLERYAFGIQPLLEKVDMNAYTTTDTIPKVLSGIPFHSNKKVTFYIHEGLTIGNFTSKGWPAEDSKHQYVVGPMPANQ